MTKVLFLLHGALGSDKQFAKICELLSPVYRCQTLLFSGHGGSAFSNGFGIDAFADELLTKLEEQGVENADIFGYSMGGYVALKAALKAPHRIGRIMTLATKFAWSPESAAKEAGMLRPEVIKEKFPAWADDLKNQHGADWKILVNKTAEMMLGLGNKPLLTADELAKIETPVLLSVGDRDKMVSIEETVAAYRNLPKAQLLVLPSTPHPFERVNTVALPLQMQQFFGN